MADETVTEEKPKPRRGRPPKAKPEASVDKLVDPQAESAEVMETQDKSNNKLEAESTIEAQEPTEHLNDESNHKAPNEPVEPIEPKTEVIEDTKGNTEVSEQIASTQFPKLINLKSMTPIYSGPNFNHVCGRVIGNATVLDEVNGFQKIIAVIPGYGKVTGYISL